MILHIQNKVNLRADQIKQIDDGFAALKKKMKVAQIKLDDLVSQYNREKDDMIKHDLWNDYCKRHGYVTSHTGLDVIS